MPGLLLGTHREVDNCPALQDLVTAPNLYNLCALPIPVPVGVGAKMFRHTLRAPRPSFHYPLLQGENFRVKDSVNLPGDTGCKW